MNDIQRTPPRIVHGAQRPKRADIYEVINKAADNAKMTKQERRLLLYLADQADGFTPAQKTIHNATGIPETRIKNVRRSLQKLSVIDYKYNEYDHFLFINWTVIRGYALLPEPLKVGGNKRKYFIQQSQNEYQNHPLRGIWKQYLYELARINKYELQQILESMEYRTEGKLI